MIKYINRTKWKKIKKNYSKVNEGYRVDSENDQVIVMQYYRRDRLNPKDHVGHELAMVSDSQDTANI